jgi:proton glutamate symport protein
VLCSTLVFPISNYTEFFEFKDDEIDGLLETVEIGSALTLLHPQYTTVVPKTSVLQFPMSYAIPKGENDFLIFLTQWLTAKKYSGLIHHANEYWVSGKGTETQNKRWSIMHDVLGWKI